MALSSGKLLPSTACQRNTFIFAASIPSSAAFRIGTGRKWRDVSILRARNDHRGLSSIETPAFGNEIVPSFS